MKKLILLVSVMIFAMSGFAQNSNTFPLDFPAAGTKLTLNSQGWVVINFKNLSAPQTITMWIGYSGPGSGDVSNANTFTLSSIEEWPVNIAQPRYSNQSPTLYIRVLCQSGQYDYSWPTPDPPGQQVTFQDPQTSFGTTQSSPGGGQVTYDPNQPKPPITAPYGPPIPAFVFPPQGSGGYNTFTAHFTDGLGYQDLAGVYVWITPFSDPNQFATFANSCLIVYYPTNGQVLLMNDSATDWIRGNVGSGVVSNTQCSIDLSHASLNNSGPDSAFTFPITFSPGFNGAKYVWGFAYGVQGYPNVVSGWVQIGTWTVVAGQPPQ